MMVSKLKYTLTFFLLLITTASFSQDDPKAKAILADVSKKFRSYDIVKADFTLTYINRQENEQETYSGTLYVQSKQNKYKVTLPQQEIISDGKTQWAYLKEDKEIQITEIDNSSDALNPAQIFTLYEKGFKYVLTGESKVGTKVYQNIELAPHATKSFSKIKLSIDKAAKTINSFSVYEKNGNIYTYTIRTLMPNVKVPATLFSFDPAKYPGVEVVDLR